MFKPCNRYLLVERSTSQQSENEIIIALPEGSFTPENRYEKVKVKALSNPAGMVIPSSSSGAAGKYLTRSLYESSLDSWLPLWCRTPKVSTA